MNPRTGIVLLFDNNGSEYVSRIQDGVTRQGRALGFPVRSENLFTTRRQVADCIGDGGAAGVILTPPLSDDRHVLSFLEQRGLPFVRIAPLLDLDRGSTVVMDEYDAARAITDLLLSKGHRRVGFMRGPRVHLVSMRRFNGYANALGGKGLRVDPGLMVEGDFSRRSGRELAHKLFAARPTAIFASNDEMAAGIIDAAHEAGIDIPGDISIVGFDDNAVARMTRPRLTSVRQPLEEMGEMACKLLLERIRNPARHLEHVSAPYQVVERDSVKEIAALAA